MTDARGEACVGDPITIATEERDHAEATCRRRVVMCSVPRLLGGIRLEATIDATQDKPDAKPSIARGEVILPARPKTNDSPIDIRATGPTQLSLTVPTRCDPASIVVSLQDHDRGARLVDVTPKGEGRFTAQIARAGRYQISVVTCDAEGFRDVEVGTKPVDVVMKLSPDAPHVGRPSALRELFANEATTCARATDESLWCWGDTLGYRGGEDVSWSLYAGVPTKMSLPVADGKQVAFGRGFACVVKTVATGSLALRMRGIARPPSHSWKWAMTRRDVWWAGSSGSSSGAGVLGSAPVFCWQRRVRKRRTLSAKTTDSSTRRSLPGDSMPWSFQSSNLSLSISCQGIERSIRSTRGLPAISQRPWWIRIPWASSDSRTRPSHRGGRLGSNSTEALCSTYGPMSQYLFGQREVMSEALERRTW